MLCVCTTIETELLCAAAAAKSLQSCLTLCDPIDGSPSGFPMPGILQARTLEWVVPPKILIHEEPINGDTLSNNLST